LLGYIFIEKHGITYYFYHQPDEGHPRHALVSGEKVSCYAYTMEWLGSASPQAVGFEKQITQYNYFGE
jgi:hypothetical protein